MLFVKFKINKKAKDFAKVFYQNNFQCYLVGGAVRNLIGKFKISDMDFTTNASPQQVMKLFPNVIPTGIKHGTVTVLFRDEKFEVTTFRIDKDYTDGRHPDEIEFTDDLVEDLQRRDFTINSIALDLQTFKIHDPNFGRKDIKKKVIRAIGIPEKRFDEDGLRILRCFRFAAQLKYKIDDATFAAAKKCRNNLKNISQERIRDELEKIVLSDRPSEIFIQLHHAGILEIILPELDACWDVGQKGYHDFDVFYHSVYACDYAKGYSPEVKWAALLHDIGKPLTKAIKDDGIATFYLHEQKSAELAQNLLTRLKFSNKEIHTITHLIAQHMFHYTPDWTDSAVKRFIARVGVEYLDELFQLREADKYGMNKKRPDMSQMNLLKKRIRTILHEGNPISLKDLRINGNDLIKIGIVPGPQIGLVLNYLLDCVIEDANQNEYDNLILIAKNFYNTRLKDI